MRKSITWFVLISFFLAFILFFVLPKFFGGVSYSKNDQKTEPEMNKQSLVAEVLPPLDTLAYDKKNLDLANNLPPPGPTTKIVKDSKTGKKTTIIIPPKAAPPNIWPVRTVYPNAGAILPFKRIVAYYGNLYSTQMGVLGEYPPDEMFTKLDAEVKKWETADPSTPVVPALHYIAVVAQGRRGEDGKYRVRMPDSEIDKVLSMAAKIHAIVFLDVQVGFSNVQTEIPLLYKYLKLPQVHLGIDPEFSMKTGIRPGKVVGTLDAKDINFAANYLAKVVRDNNLTPKILIIHRYTQNMVTNYKEIKPLPEVQIVINMDGWGWMSRKIGTYTRFIYPEPVQFTGFKLFYKNDVKNPGTVLMTPADVLKLQPRPIYIQYQ